MSIIFSLTFFSFRLIPKQAGFPFAARWLPTAAMHAIFKVAITFSRTIPPHGNSSNWFSINFFTFLYLFLGFCNTLFLSKFASISFMMSISIPTHKVTGNWKKKIQKIKLIVNSSSLLDKSHPQNPYTLAEWNWDSTSFYLLTIYLEKHFLYYFYLRFIKEILHENANWSSNTEKLTRSFSNLTLITWFLAISRHPWSIPTVTETISFIFLALMISISAAWKIIEKSVYNYFCQIIY